MTSKLKTDVLETVSGSGTIALTNQLSGMTTASLPALGSAQMPTGSLLKTSSFNFPPVATTTSTGYTNAGSSQNYTVTNAGCHLYITCHFNLNRHSNFNYWAVSRLLIDGQSYATLECAVHGVNNDYARASFAGHFTGLSLTAGQVLVFQQQIKTSSSSGAVNIGDGNGTPTLIIQEIKV